MENVITLNSTRKGLAGKYVHDTFWMFFNLALLYVFHAIAYWRMGSYGTHTIKEFLSITDLEAYDFLLLVCLAIGVVIVAVVAFCYLCDLPNNLYLEKTQNVVDRSRKIITGTSYGFPYKVDTNELKFDRVMRVDVSQGTFDKILNTGSITVKTLTYANADTVETSWKIPYINDPFGAKERILAGLPEYSGLEVRIKKDEKEE